MKLTKLKTLLTAALVAGAGPSAWAEDAPEEVVVAFGEAEFWLGGDEMAVASGEGELFWLGPDEVAVATGEKKFPLMVFRALRSDGDIEPALRASGAVDKVRILELIGSSPDVYRAFKAWAEGLGDIAVAASVHAGDSFAFGVEELFENAPEVRFTDVSVNTNESGTLDVTVTVMVKDGDKSKPVKSENVAQMFEATTNVADWTEGRVETTVTDRTKDLATPVEFTVTPGDGTSEKAFLRIRK